MFISNNIVGWCFKIYTSYFGIHMLKVFKFWFKFYNEDNVDKNKMILYKFQEFERKKVL